MTPFVPWDSQPLAEWAEKHAAGKFVDLDGYTAHYLEKGEGEPLILIYGFFLDTFMWSKNINTLAQKFKVYALDLWGLGYSSREPMDYGYPLYAGQLRKFMDALHIEKASLVGQSMGAGTAILFSVEHSERVNKLILVNAAGMPNRLALMGRIANLSGVGEFLFRCKGNFTRRMTLKNTFIRNKKIITEQFFENATRFHKIRGTNGALLKICRKQFFDKLPDEIHRLGEMDIPILLVWGRHDKAVPLKCGRQMHRILKTSRLEILDPAGHCSNMEQPERFNALALDFLLT